MSDRSRLRLGDERGPVIEATVGALHLGIEMMAEWPGEPSREDALALLTALDSLDLRAEHLTRGGGR